jgi:hypothetical protein
LWCIRTCHNQDYHDHPKDDQHDQHYATLHGVIIPVHSIDPGFEYVKTKVVEWAV